MRHKPAAKSAATVTAAAHQADCHHDVTVATRHLAGQSE
jgi:hypothetical protein